MRVWLERVGNLSYAMRRRGEHDAHMRWSRDRLDAYRQERLEAIVRHAAAHSPFYRRHLGPLPAGRIELAQLPILTKAAMMAAYDELVTDPRLRLGPLQAHLATVRADETFAGEFRVMASSGSSGQKAVFAYDREAWRGGFLQASLRLTRMVGIRPSPRRPRLATIAAPDGKHMTFRGATAMDVGIFRSRRIPANLPLAEMVAALDAFQPEFVLGYPSVLALLAEEQAAGRLRITPRVITTTSEVCTAAMSQRIEETWGVRPHDCLGMTETGILAVDCTEHAGLHVFEDLAIVEVVDADNREVPYGTPGAKLLVTNLYNRAQPIIRFEVSDLVTMTDAPCPCGVTFRRIVALDGRSDDLLEIGAARIHPIHLRSALAADRRVVQYQVTQEAARLDVQVVLSADATADTPRELAASLERALRALGAELPVEIRAVAAIAREEGAGKLKLVRRGAR